MISWFLLCYIQFQTGIQLFRILNLICNVNVSVNKYLALSISLRILRRRGLPLWWGRISRTKTNGTRKWKRIACSACLSPSLVRIEVAPFTYRLDSIRGDSRALLLWFGSLVFLFNFFHIFECAWVGHPSFFCWLLECSHISSVFKSLHMIELKSIRDIDNVTLLGTYWWETGAWEFSDRKIYGHFHRHCVYFVIVNYCMDCQLCGISKRLFVCVFVNGCWKVDSMPFGSRGMSRAVFEAIDFDK